jgi:arylsulfatase A-like enzyme
MKCLYPAAIFVLWAVFGLAHLAAAERPHIILVMADDMGWGETSYHGHPILQTPHLDEMAANGLRFNRFYAGGPVCSPTRATVLTGRAHDRTAVYSHGHALRLQEKTLAQALQTAGYRTGHFGKWHLNGLQGPGLPIPADDPYHPGKFGFDEWLSVSNFFDLDPLLSRRGELEAHHGDSSEVVVDQAVKFLAQHRHDRAPLFAVIWFGSPHLPFRPLETDKAAFASLDENSANHYGEMVGVDRSVGTLRRKLRELDLAANTLVIFCSDNGGLPNLEPETVGGLRGHKGSVFEGGLRVPAIIEWPAAITPRVTDYPASTLDIFPTIASIVDLPTTAMLTPIDGESLQPLFAHEAPPRTTPIPFRYQGKWALVDNHYKMISADLTPATTELYDLSTDPKESQNIASQKPAVAQRLRQHLISWNASVEASIAGLDYPEREVSPADPAPVRWNLDPAYQSFLDQWGDRPEFRDLPRPAHQP